MEILSTDLEGNVSRRTRSETPGIVVPDYRPLTELPDYSSEVKKIENSPTKSYGTKHGDVEAFTVTMDDGTCYSIRVGTPHEQLSDTAVVSGTAWFTSPDLEHYRKVVRGTLKLGYPTVIVGPPTVTRAKDVSLSKSTHDMQRVLDEVLPTINVDPEKAIAIGPSRAATLAIGLSVKKYAGDRTIPYGDIVAPPMPNGITQLEWPRVRNHLAKEIAETRHTALGAAKSGKLAAFALSLIPRDKEHNSNSARMLHSFLRGEAGLLADHSDARTAWHIVEFIKDYWAQIPGYEEKFAGRKNVYFVRQDGYHIEGIARPTTRRDTYARLELLREKRGFDGSFTRKVNIPRDILPFQPFADKDRETKNRRLLGLPVPNIPGYKKAA